MSPERAEPAMTRTAQPTAVRHADRASVTAATPVSAESRDFLRSNPAAMIALQRAAGNAATATIQRDRAELDKAYNDDVGAGQWEQAAIRLNGFSNPDINSRLKDLGYDKRKLLLAANPEWNHRVRTPALDLNFSDDVGAGRMESAATLLNGFSDTDITDRFGKLPTDKHLAMLIACPAFAKRVLDIGLHLGAKQGSRTWPPADFIAIWEKLHDRKMTDEEKVELKRGCIGITVLNLNDDNVNPPLGLSFDTFDRALAVAKAINDILATAETSTKYDEMVDQHPLLKTLKNVKQALGSFTKPAEWKGVVFSKRFWSNQSADWKKRFKGDKKAFLADKKTGQVDMSGYNYYGRSEGKQDQQMVAFDYGWYDEDTNTWWHANHRDLPDDPMKVYQSTLAHYSRPLLNFDRQVFTVALAKKPGGT